MSIQPEGGIVPELVLRFRLRIAREISGMSATELGSHIDLSRNAISNYENGKRVPKRSVLIAWAMCTGVNLTWLETGEDPPSGGDDGSSDESSPGWTRTSNHSITGLAAVVDLFPEVPQRELVAA